MMRRSLLRFGGAAAGGHGHGSGGGHDDHHGDGHGDGHDDHGHHHHHGLPLHEIYPKGLPKRTTPMRDHGKHPAFSPSPGGFFMTKYAIALFHPPLEINFYRAPLGLLIIMIAYDLTFGLPGWLFLNKEKADGTSSHYYWGNNGGVPHALWQHQDGWYIPNHSGIKRMVP